MSLDQIHAFVAVAEEGSVRRASVRLHISQPPLTRRIHDLEDELGARLFDRIPSGMRLAPPGEAFLAHARRILSAVDDARASVRAEGGTAPARSPVVPSWPASPSARSSSSSS
jgi:DNA-binding transcriptional LysR family regulator